MSIKKNLFKNGVATGIQKLVKVLEQLLLVPFFISAWGVSFYGEWLTLTIVPSMLAFSDLGFGSAAANTFVLRYVSGDKKGAADVSKSGFYIICCTVTGGILIGGIAIIICNYFGLFQKSLIPKNDAIWAVSILMVARMLSFFQQLYEAYYRSARRASLSTNLSSGYSLVSLAISIVVLKMGFGIVIFSLATLAVSVVFYLFYALLAEHVLGLRKEFKGNFNKTDIRGITGKGFGYLLAPIWQSIYFQGTTFVVRATLGPAAVAIFNTVRTVSRSANQAFNMVNFTVFPELQFEIGANRLEKARKLFRLALVLVLIIAVGGILLLGLFGSVLYKKWTHNALIPPTAMWNIFLIGIALNALWWTAEVMFRAVNKPYGIGIMGLISAVASVILSYFLSLKLGLTGAAIGSLTLDLFMALYVLPASCKILHQNIVTLPKDAWNDVVDLIHKARKAKSFKLLFKD